MEADRDGTSVPLGGQQQRAVLTMLVLQAGRVVPVSSLVDGCWQGRVPGRAVNTVQVYVSALRRALGRAVISTHGRGYRLERDTVAVDLHEFLDCAAEARVLHAAGRHDDAADAITGALALWRGPALAEFADLPFAGPEAVALEEARLAALETRAGVDLDRGAHAEAVAALTGLVAAHPLRERFQARLVEALYRDGRRADALAAYRTARTMLADELGVEPGPELRELHRRVLADDALPAPRGAHLLLQDGGGGPVVVSLDPARGAVSVGRRSGNDLCLGWDQEVSRVHAWLEHDGTGWSLVDNGLSRNGSFVDGRRVEGAVALLDGQVLRFGATTAIYRDRGGGSDVRVYSGVTSDGVVRSAAQLSDAERDGLGALGAGRVVDAAVRVALYRRFGVVDLPVEERDGVLLARARAIGLAPVDGASPSRSA
ncbi:FHA domain-containing protein [Pseudonocardia sp. DR1-2]|uniref:BTAD domain-containing putative transcriptional regulator n=1 Tax=Pseudonocardia sp. DR1-2 TaxID=2951168 RepID=UPI002044BE56|nr:BTAD domain-containing putative transcriptional regulator [Pseudonocardia sp. DR1-2]MCM3849097.1 FHA domain-containing protein [Pseudonocardia sp. DR1-2]